MLVDTGCGYPGLLLANSAGQVQGEVYEVDKRMLEQLDQLERD